MTSTASANRPTAPLLMLLGGLFLFSIQDVLISDLTKRYPVHEIVFVRSLVNIWPLILLSFAFDQGKNMQITKFWQLFLRGGLLSLSYTAYYLALAGLDFAQATSLYFTARSPFSTAVPVGTSRFMLNLSRPSRSLTNRGIREHSSRLSRLIVVLVCTSIPARSRRSTAASVRSKEPGIAVTFS